MRATCFDWALHNIAAPLTPPHPSIVPNPSIHSTISAIHPHPHPQTHPNPNPACTLHSFSYSLNHYHHSTPSQSQPRLSIPHSQPLISPPIPSRRPSPSPAFPPRSLSHSTTTHPHLNPNPAYPPYLLSHSFHPILTPSKPQTQPRLSTPQAPPHSPPLTPSQPDQPHLSTPWSQSLSHPTPTQTTPIHATVSTIDSTTPTPS